MNMAVVPPSLSVLSGFYTELLFVIVAVVLLGLDIWLLARWHPNLQSPVPVWRTRLRIGLGALWIMDGLLQAQPGMVTRFVGGLVAPLVGGQPRLLAAAIEAGVRLWGVNPVQANVFAAFIQLLIGVLLVTAGEAAPARIGLWVSLVWSAIIWIFGEGLGGIFVGGNWLQGAPGSASLYAAAAVLLLVPADLWTRNRAREAFRFGMAGLFSLAAFLQAWPPSGDWTATGLYSFSLSMAEMAQPHVAAVPEYIWASLLRLHPILGNGAVTALLAGLAVLWLVRPSSWALWWATVGFTLLTWWLGQDWGVFGGMSTDPNTGAILLVLLFAYGAELASIRSWRGQDEAAPIVRPLAHRQ